MSDDSMSGTRIRLGGMLVIDCSPISADGEPVVVINGERTLRRTSLRDGQFLIEPPDGAGDSTKVGERGELVGVTRYIIPIAGERR
jgi:SOS-response transcriptional repressor LexA